MRIGIISGYFNPIHKGHIELIQRAKEQVDMLMAIVNNDHQRHLKGSKEFMDENERCFIVANIKGINGAYLSIDKDRTVRESIGMVVSNLRELYSNTTLQFFFINGGDRLNSEIPESKVCSELGVDIVDGFGDKVQSSSWLLAKQ